MKIWHDDVRRPPDDTWLWARTNDQARTLFKIAGPITEISLDHDMGGHELDPDNPESLSFAGNSEENGLILVTWMIQNNLVPEKITIHSWNSTRAKLMALLLNDAGHNVTLAPFRIS